MGGALVALALTPCWLWAACINPLDPFRTNSDGKCGGAALARRRVPYGANLKVALHALLLDTAPDDVGAAFEFMAA